MWRSADSSFIVVLVFEEEARVVQMRPVTLGLSGPVGGSVSVSGGDMDVSTADTVVSVAVRGCLYDLGSGARGDIVVSLDEMSLSGGSDAVVYGVDEYVCGVSSVMTAGELDVCGCDSAVSGEAGDSSKWR